MNRKALKRIPLHKLFDLKVDFAFKQLFGSEKNKEITIVFLNAILARTGRNTIKEVMFVNQELGGEYLDDKQSRLDIGVCQHSCRIELNSFSTKLLFVPIKIPNSIEASALCLLSC